MDRKRWIEDAALWGGRLVVWIDQGNDRGLQDAYSRGVCFELTKAWVAAYTGYRVDRAAFVQSFGRYDAATRIPPEYIRRQQEYSRQVQANRLRFETAFNDLQVRIRLGEQVDPNQLREAFAASRQAFYGPACETFDNYRTEAEATSAVFDDANAGPGYHMLSMLAPVSHVVAFELRPDVIIEPNFPNGLYEYFDANLGLFVFPSADELRNFWAGVQMAVYPNAATVELASFGIGRGGFAKTWGEVLSEVWQWIVAQWNAIWGTNPALAALEAMVANARTPRQEAP